MSFGRVLCLAYLGSVMACGSAGPSTGPAAASGSTSAPAPAPVRSPSTSPTPPPNPNPAWQLGECRGYGARAPIRTSAPPYWIPEFDKQGLCSLTPSGALSSGDGPAAKTETLQASGRSFQLSSIGPLGVASVFEIGISWEQDCKRRGVCLIRSEQGFRYVAVRGDVEVRDALAWLTDTLQDVDGDGTVELVLVEDAWVGPSRGSPAITATAYDLRGTTLQLDRGSTRKLRSELAAVYQRAADSAHADSSLRDYYAAAVAQLRSPLCLLKEGAAAQATSAAPTPIDAIWADVADAFWGYNLLFHAGALAVTGVMSQSGADDELRAQAQSHFDSGTWNEVANIGGYVVPLATAPTIWVVGLVARDRTIAGAGSAALLALGVTAATTGLLKVVTGRADPAAGDELEETERGREFRPFENDIGAWPSGHAASTISITAALTAYAPEHLWIPLIGYPLGLALGIGMVERDSHWASDVVGGALIGHGIGYSIGRSFRKRVRGEPVDEKALHLTPLAGARGLALTGRW